MYRILAFCAIAVMVVMICGCGGGGSSAALSPPATPETGDTVTFGNFVLQTMSAGIGDLQTVPLISPPTADYAFTGFYGAIIRYLAYSRYLTYDTERTLSIGSTISIPSGAGDLVWRDDGFWFIRSLGASEYTLEHYSMTGEPLGSYPLPFIAVSATGLAWDGTYWWIQQNDYSQDPTYKLDGDRNVHRVVLHSHQPASRAGVG